MRAIITPGSKKNGVTEAAEKLLAIRESIEARKRARLACTPEQIKAYCLANHWAAVNKSCGYTRLRHRTDFGTNDATVPDSRESCEGWDFDELIERVLHEISLVELRPMSDVIQAVANHKNKDNP